MILEIAQIALWSFGVLLLVATLLSLSRLPHGAIQGLSFVRLQMFVLSVLGVALMPLVQARPWVWAGVLLFLGVAAVNAAFIAKFTPLWKVQAIKPEPGFRDLEARSARILASNVKLSNRDYGRFVAMVEREDPDILIAVELDQKWIDGIAAIRDRYTAHVEVPLDTGYGVILYSKLPMKQVQVREVVTEGVPSIRAAVQLPIGAWFRLYVVHPEPPVATHDTKGRDSEIALAGIEAEADRLPAIVTGDLNDVAWSTTTRRFQRLSGLLDPRVGRGFYNTFNAFYPMFRWPLDHLFHDPMFRHLDMRRLPGIGSDHFPMLFALALASAEGESELPEEATEEEEEEVAEMIAEEKARDREAIGSDWEQG